MADPVDLDLSDPGTNACPYYAYARLREDAPAYKSVNHNCYVVSRYEDVLAILRDPQTFSSNFPSKLHATVADDLTAHIQEILAEGPPEVEVLVHSDPPQHARYRGLVGRAFTPRRVAQLEDTISRRANELVDRFATLERIDFVSQFAAPLPALVLADALGIVIDDLARFKELTDTMLARRGSRYSREDTIRAAKRKVEFKHEITDLIEARRSGRYDDLLSDIVNAQVDGEEPLTLSELVGTVEQLIAAGVETSAAHLSKMMLLLLQAPDLLQQARNDFSLIPRIIDETLRLETPAQAFWRVTTKEVEVAGINLPADTLVMVLFGAANRDPAHFPDPDRLDIHRQDVRSHLGFGWGIHRCLGAALAMAELRISFEILFTRLPHISLAEDAEVRHNRNFVVRSLKSLPLMLSPRS